jgi:DNA-binding response OmpR family regulator
VASDEASLFVELARALPAAMVLDLHLGKSNGLTVLRQVRATAGVGQIPVAVVTGDYLVDERVIRDLEELGAELFFKPLWEEDILRIVRKLLP